MVKPRIRYEVDPQNRLVVSSGSAQAGLPEFRKVLDGYFFITKEGSLAYHLKKQSGLSLPQQIKFSGKWSLGPDDGLLFTLDKWNNQCEGDKLSLECGVVSADSRELVFSALTRGLSGGGHYYLLKLSGKWQADKFNRLIFSVSRENGPTQQLIFSGAWEVGGNNKLTYRYSREELKKKKKITQEFSLEGSWDIGDKHRLSYVLERKLGSQFDFKASFEKPLANAVQYRLGIGVSGKKRAVRIFGSWKVNERLGIYFEALPARRSGRALLLGSVYKINKGLILEVALRNGSGKDLGVEAKLSRKFFKGEGEFFLKALASRRENSISAGAGVLW